MTARDLTKLSAVVLVACLLATGFSFWACSYLVRRYYEAILIECRAAVERTNTALVDRGKLDMCREAIEQTCAIQWGQRCIGKKVGKSPYAP